LLEGAKRCQYTTPDPNTAYKVIHWVRRRSMYSASPIKMLLSLPLILERNWSIIRGWERRERSLAGFPKTSIKRKLNLRKGRNRRHWSNNLRWFILYPVRIAKLWSFTHEFMQLQNFHQQDLYHFIFMMHSLLLLPKWFQNEKGLEL